MNGFRTLQNQKGIRSLLRSSSTMEKILLRKSALEITALTWARTLGRNTQEQLFNRFESANILRSISRVIQISSTPKD